MLHLDDLAIFVSIVEQKSFTKAAKILQIPKATLSRRFADFEKKTKQTLLHRSTRNLALTEKGLLLYEASVETVKQGLHIQEVFISKSTHLEANITLNCSESIAKHLLLPYIKGFSHRYPKLQVAINSQSDLALQAIDIHIAMDLKDRPLNNIKKLSDLRYWLVATPDYLKSSPKLSSLQDLHKLDVIAVSQDRQVVTSQNFNIGGQSVAISSKYFASNESIALDMVKQHLGFALLPDYLVKHDIKSAALFCIFPQYPSDPVEVSIAIDPKCKNIPASLVLRDYLIEHVPKKHLLRLAG